MRGIGKRNWLVLCDKENLNCKLSVKEMFSKIYLYKIASLQAHSSSGEFPSITLSACDDDDDDEDDDDLFTIQRDTVLDVGEVTMIFGDGNSD